MGRKLRSVGAMGTRARAQAKMREVKMILKVSSMKKGKNRLNKKYQAKRKLLSLLQRKRGSSDWYFIRDLIKI